MQTTSPFSFTLTEQVQAAVVLHPHLKQRHVELSTKDGCVTLKGSVESYYEKQMAQEAVRNIAGITTIENCLEVNWSR